MHAPSSPPRPSLLQAAAAVAALLACLLAPAPAPAGEPLQPTVQGPLPDTIRLGVPEGLGNPELAALGYLDVTADPFHADNSGESDATSAIQAAIEYARDRQLVAFFPGGTYLVSDTIECVQNRYRRTSGKAPSGRFFPCVLKGSRTGPRPRIMLAAGSAGFADPFAPKSVLRFRSRSAKEPGRYQTNIAFNQQLVGIDVVIGPDNPGAVGIELQGAQGSGVKECTIDARHGLIGLRGGTGSGGSHADVTVLGGRVGLDLRASQPAPVISGVTLLDQRGPAIVYSGRQSLTVLGFRIASSHPGPAVIADPVRWTPFSGQLCLVDGIIEFSGQPGTGVAAGASLYLHNVFFRNARTAADLTADQDLAGAPGGWFCAATYAAPIQPPAFEGFAYRMAVFTPKGATTAPFFEPGPHDAPGFDPVARHALPRVEPVMGNSALVVATRAPYKAAGDGLRDDTDALQAALDTGRTVFLPKGIYRIDRPLDLPPGATLMGAAGHLSLIVPGKDFGKDGAPSPLVRTAFGQDAANRLAGLGLYVPAEAPAAYGLHWRGGRGGARGLNVIDWPPRPELGEPAPRNHPTLLFTDQASGAFHDLFLEGWTFQGPGHRHLAVRGANGPLRFVMLDPEHGRGQAQFEVSQSENVAVYGLKSEGNHVVARLSKSRNVAIVGYGGNAVPRPGGALFELDDCRSCRLANLVETPRLAGQGSPEHFAGQGADPDGWVMVRERAGDAIRRTPPLSRPVLYLTGAGP